VHITVPQVNPWQNPWHSLVLNTLYRQFNISDLPRSSNRSFWLEVWLFNGIEFGDDAWLKISSKTQCAASYILSMVYGCVCEQFQCLICSWIEIWDNRTGSKAQRYVWDCSRSHRRPIEARYEATLLNCMWKSDRCWSELKPMRAQSSTMRSRSETVMSPL